MSTLSGLIDITRSALLADQSALSATANNVANQNTVGYTTEVASFSANDTVQLGAGGGAVGSPTVAVTSVRDRVLEQRVEQLTQQQSASAAQAAVLSQVEGIFSLSSSAQSPGSTLLGSAIDGLFSSLTALASNPADPTTQQAAVTAATQVSAAFGSAASGLASIASGINTALATAVPSVNALTTTIAQLNGEINNWQNGGQSGAGAAQDAGALEDQRQNAIAQLSQLIGVNQVKTEANGLTLTTTGGAVLVSGSKAYALSSAQTGGSTKILDYTGANVTAGITGGTIGGQLAAQSSNLPAVSSALDALAYRIGSAVNTQNEAGLTSSGVAGAAVFTLPSTSAGAAAQLAVVATAAFDHGRDRGGKPGHDQCEPARVACVARGLKPADDHRLARSLPRRDRFEQRRAGKSEHRAAGFAHPADRAARLGLCGQPGHAGGKPDDLSTVLPGRGPGPRDREPALCLGNQPGEPNHSHLEPG